MPFCSKFSVLFSIACTDNQNVNESESDHNDYGDDGDDDDNMDSIQNSNSSYDNINISQQRTRGRSKRLHVSGNQI